MTTSLDLQDAQAVCQRLHDAADALLQSPLRDGCVHRLPRRGQLLVTGDLHDNPIHLGKVLRLARLDRPDHHVVLHEMIHGDRLVNGMDFSHRILIRVADLILRHPGQVHPVLANHEMSQMTGAGVSKGSGNNVDQFNDALEFVFNESWVDVQDAINALIAAMPLALMSESGVSVSHSLPGEPQMNKFDMDIIGRALEPADYLRPDGSAYLMTWGRSYTDESVAKLAAHWNIKLFCVGHQHAEAGIEAVGKQVLVLNTDHEQATTIIVDLCEDPPPLDLAIMSAIPLASIPE